MGLPKKLKDLISHYTYRIEWDAADSIYIVTVEELSGCMTHGSTPEEALQMGQEAAEGHLESLHQHGEEIPVPFSMQKFKGEFLVRGNPDLHRKLAVEASRKGFKSLNKFVVAELEKVVS